MAEDVKVEAPKTETFEELTKRKSEQKAKILAKLKK